MRKLTLGLANSLDNYISRQDGGPDWLYWDDEIAKLSAKFMKTVDAILIGRKTYEVMLGFDQAAYPGARNYVFSRTMKKSPSKQVEIVSAFNADLINEVVLNIHPVLLGSGIPLFHEMERQIDLELLNSQTNKKGNLIVSYRVKH